MLQLSNVHSISINASFGFSTDLENEFPKKHARVYCVERKHMAQINWPLNFVKRKKLQRQKVQKFTEFVIMRWLFKNVASLVIFASLVLTPITDDKIMRVVCRNM